MTDLRLVKPEAGDRVALRGRPQRGVLRYMSPRMWCTVEWDADTPGPRLCHRNELEKEADA